MEERGELVMAIWDESVLEKPESIAREGLCPVRSSKGLPHQAFLPIPVASWGNVTENQPLRPSIDNANSDRAQVSRASSADPA